MDADTLAALEGSIAKWEAIVAGTGFDHGTVNCPLCKMFYEGISDDSCCDNCPISNKTGVSYCYGTPYEKWSAHQEDAHGNSDKVECADCLRLAQAELDFLKSLLPAKG